MYAASLLSIKTVLLSCSVPKTATVIPAMQAVRLTGVVRQFADLDPSGKVKRQVLPL